MSISSADYEQPSDIVFNHHEIKSINGGLFGCTLEYKTWDMGKSLFLPIDRESYRESQIDDYRDHTPLRAHYCHRHNQWHLAFSAQLPKHSECWR